MTFVVVRLDIVDVDRLGYARYLVQVFHVAPQIRVINQPANVALEVTHIHRVETHHGGKQAPVCLGNRITHELALGRQTLFQ